MVVSALRNCFGAAAYRWIALLLLSSATASSLVAPVLALFAGSELGASEFQITSYFATNALCGIGVVLLVGKLSDGVGQRRFFVAGGFLWLALGYAILSFAADFMHMRLVGAFFLSALEVGNVQLFALAREMGGDSPAEKKMASSITSNLRTAYVLGWVMGPAIGGGLVLFLTQREVLQVSAVLYVACAVLAVWLLPERRAVPGGGLSPGFALGSLLHRDRRALLVFGAAVAFLLAGDVLRLALVPVLLSKSLMATPEAVSLTFSISPLLQITMMPVVGILADRYGSGRLVFSGAMAGLLYYGCLTAVSAIWQVYVLQVLYAFLVSAVIGVGISHAQQLADGEAGLATSAYFAAKLVSVVAGSLASGLVAERYGVRLVWWVPAAMCLLGGVLTLMVIDPGKQSRRVLRVAPTTP